MSQSHECDIGLRTVDQRAHSLGRDIPQDRRIAQFRHDLRQALQTVVQLVRDQDAQVARVARSDPPKTLA